MKFPAIAVKPPAHTHPGFLFRSPFILPLLTLLVFLEMQPRASHAAPQMLLESPLESPEGNHAANVEWDAAGFIGRIRMKVYPPRSNTASVTAELPQIKPAPANLTWINEDWFACESFVAEDGAAFCYMSVPRQRAYLIEIFAPKEQQDWVISYTTNDSISSDTIQTVSQGHSSLFPILLRELPREGLPYLSPDFAVLLSDGIESFTEWRKKENFREIKHMSPIAEKPELGRLIVATVDDHAEIIYFPGGTTTTREMLALTKRQALPDNIQQRIAGVDPPDLVPEWTDDSGAFRILATWPDRPTSTTEVLTGRFEGISDSPYTGPGISELIAPARSSSSSSSAPRSGGGGSNTRSTTKSTSANKSSSSRSSNNSKSSSSSKSSSTRKTPSRSN